MKKSLRLEDVFYKPRAFPICIVDGEPYYEQPDMTKVIFVGMEVDPNTTPRYGKVYHPWHNLPCYETRIQEVQSV